MSLDFNYGKIKNYKEKCEVVDENGKVHHNRVTQHLAWGSFIGVYLQNITEKNVDEWRWRIAFLKRINCPWMSDGFLDDDFDPADYIGWDTNCFPSKNRKAFIKKYTDMLVKEIDRAQQRLAAESDTEAA